MQVSIMYTLVLIVCVCVWLHSSGSSSEVPPDNTMSVPEPNGEAKFKSSQLYRIRYLATSGHLLGSFFPLFSLCEQCIHKHNGSCNTPPRLSIS